MARLNVNPTRMELKKLKVRLKTAVRGHKLLKDKTDEMVRRFTIIIKHDRLLREEVEKSICNVLGQFACARSLLSLGEIELAFSMPSVKLNIQSSTKNIMNVDVPKLEIVEEKSNELLPYSFASVTSEADYSVEMIAKIMPKLVELAEVEKSMYMLSNEIEKNKRRVNALEHVMIPQIEETIKYIQMKLDENERGSLTRLMKVKAMIENR